MRNNQLFDLRDPVTLQQLRCTRPIPRISVKAPFQEINPLFTQLILAWQLGGVSLGDIIHNRPFIIERSPRAPAGAHFEDDAAKGPDIDGAKATLITTFDNFGGHIHRSAGHGFLFGGDFSIWTGASDGNQVRL